ncbi:hypothetical protein [Comamonas koreensis]|uniref:Uncharacterized protein n=1 Tax=Comamonas koreensis TaxID=160825 RepID=A0AAW4XT55_9BURK|nr:hypothetical protein [Comamonas koreensis]MCD2164295.1 hypothetical protein [Comamonas koreensis]
MSLRRKIALWLCPELGGPAVEPILPFPHAQHKGSAEAWASNLGAIADLCRGSAIHAGERIIPSADNKALIQSLKASQHAHDELWKAEVLDLLRLLNATLTSVTEGGNAMKVTILK